MDAKLISERHVIERYLAGQLSDAEAEELERAVEARPELAQEVERIARLKTGLEVLERRGDLPKLLAPPVAAPKRRAVWVAAAGVAALALGLLLLRPADVPTPPTLLALSLESLSAHSDSPIPLRASIALARARGMGADAELTSSGKAPGAAELELATGGDAGASYSVELLSVDDHGARAVSRVPAIATDATGAVHVFVALHALSPGPYLLRLTPNGPGVPVEYSIALRPAR